MSTEKSSVRDLKRIPRQVGRPRKSNNTTNENTAKEILKVAARLFSLKGYAGTTMAEIADEVGVRGPTLYYHYREKPDLLRELADIGLSSTTKIAAKLREEQSLSPAARLHLLIQIQVEDLRSSKYELNCLFDPAFHDKEFSDIYIKLTAWMKTLEGQILEGVKSGQIDIEDTELAAYTVRGMIALSVRELAKFRHLSPKQMGLYIANFALTAIIKNESTLKSIHKELGVYNADV